MGALENLIRRVRRRFLWNMAAERAALVLCALLSGALILLVTGVDLLDWRWSAVPALAVLGLALRSLRRNVPSLYRVAQTIDRRMGFRDSISTAFYYNRVAEDGKAGADMRAAQLAEAGRLARQTVPARAAPFTAPRALYAAAVLGLIGSGLLTMRYSMSGTLDLRPPLARFALDGVDFATRTRARQPEDSAALSKQSVRTDPAGDNFQNNGSADPKPPGAAKDALAKQSATDQEPNQAANESARLGDAMAENTTPDDGRRTRSSRPAGRGSSEGDGLLEKFRDAMANLLSRLKSPASGQPEAGADQAQSQAQSRQEKGPSAKPIAGRQSGDAQSELQGANLEKAVSGPGQQGGPEGDPTSQPGQNGAGREDGRKDLREAEQLAAMGKISEILGRRAQDLTGEMTVEVEASREQQLRTTYSQQAASHTGSGGEIHRDEIPLAYQRYVRQYFEEIRKTPPPARQRQ